MLGRVVEQAERRGDDAGGIGADEPERAGVHALGPLGLVAQDEGGHVERRRLLLDSAGVGEHQGRAGQEPDELLVVHGLDDADVAERAEHRVHGAADVRVRVHREDEVDLGARGGELGDRAADVLQAVAERLAPVRGDEDERAGRVERGQLLREDGHVVAHAAGDGEDGVDPGVAGDVDRAGRDALGEKVLAREAGRGEVEVGEARGERAVRLLRIGRGRIAGAQAGLDVRDRDARVERGERAREGGGRVALDDDEVGVRVFEDRLQALEHGRRDVREVLAGAHEVEVVVGSKPEEAERLVEQPAVLGGGGEDRKEAAVGAKRLHDWGKLDRLRAGAEGQKDAQGHGKSIGGGGVGLESCLRPSARDVVAAVAIDQRA